jgi:hypothetical protein
LPYGGREIYQHRAREFQKMHARQRFSS